MLKKNKLTQNIFDSFANLLQIKITTPYISQEETLALSSRHDVAIALSLIEKKKHPFKSIYDFKQFLINHHLL